MSFENPAFLWLLLSIPLVFLFLFFQKKNRPAVFLSVQQDLQKAQGGLRGKVFPLLNGFLILLLLLLFSVTLARPQSNHEKEEVSKKGIDILLALDVSESMLAEDLKPNRMTAAKESISAFLPEESNDRIGIIVFSGKAFTQSPLTFDTNIIKEYISNISTDSINQRVRGLNGTAVGDAILAAITRFQDSGDRSKVLILATDGDSNVGINPDIAAQKADDEGIKIYTIGIGKKGGAALPYYDNFGRKQYARNRDGSLVMATFNEQALKNISEQTGGKYFRAENKQGFENILQEIDQLQKRDIVVKNHTEYKDIFEPFLWSLLLCFFLFLLLRIWRPLFS